MSYGQIWPRMSINCRWARDRILYHPRVQRLHRRFGKNETIRDAVRLLNNHFLVVEAPWYPFSEQAIFVFSDFGSKPSIKRVFGLSTDKPTRFSSMHGKASD